MAFSRLTLNEEMNAICAAKTNACLFIHLSRSEFDTRGVIVAELRKMPANSFEALSSPISDIPQRWTIKEFNNLWKDY
jgi:hypothetical protein